MQDARGGKMALDTRLFTDKDSKKPEYLKLYQDLPFIEAYGKHTDIRIKKDGPQLAIGAKPDGFQDWDIHGKAQYDFLQYAGLKPSDTLLDVGCGTGRLARKIVPFLDSGNYTGIDISQEAINQCKLLAIAEQFDIKNPVFIHGDGTLKGLEGRKFNIIWAHSVFTHIPPEVVEWVFDNLSRIDFDAFYFTHKGATEITRSGLKQFAYPVKYFADLADDYNMIAESIKVEWPAGQKTIKVTR